MDKKRNSKDQRAYYKLVSIWLYLNYAHTHVEDLQAMEIVDELKLEIVRRNFRVCKPWTVPRLTKWGKLSEKGKIYK